MKSFDSASIKARLLEYLKTYVDESGAYVWRRVLNDSAIQSVLFAISEDSAESARYFEYLLKEAKWDRMKNESSAWAQAGYLGYNPHRQISSIGTLYLSHDSLLRNAGISLFEEDLTSLTDYTGTNIPIPPGTRFTNGSLEFISTLSKTYETGLKYLEIPVIQGVRKAIRTQVGAQGVSFESIRFLNSNIEAALDSISQQFFTVTVFLGGDLSLARTATRVEDIHLAGPVDLSYDVTTASDYSSITVRFGDGLTGMKLPVDSIVELGFLETTGAIGNVALRNTISEIVTPLAGALYCTNFDPTLGGSNNETLESIVANAPSYYLIADRSIVTADAYIQNIEAIPYVHKANVTEGVYTSPLTGIEQNAILFTAITTEGLAPPSTIREDLLVRTNTRRPPLDYLVYEEPERILLSLGIQANTSLSDVDLPATQTALQDLLLDKYDILKQDFENSFDSSEDVALCRQYGEANDISLKNVTELVEATLDLLPSDFTVTTVASRFEHSFVFADLLSQMKKFEDGVTHCLKIQILFTCPGCEANSRTIFLIQNDAYDPLDPSSLQYSVVQYPYISRITTKDYMQNSVLTPGMGYDEILPSDDNYISISVTMDYLDDLSSGTLTIPIYKKDGTSMYLNFNSSDKDALDEGVSIHVSAEPARASFKASNYKEIIYSNLVTAEVEYTD
jgi:hypothetical protein